MTFSEPTVGRAEQSGIALTIHDNVSLPTALVEGSNHIFRYVNPAFCRLVNSAKEDLLGKRFAEKVPESAECQTLLDRVYKTGASETLVKRHSLDRTALAFAMWAVASDSGPTGILIHVNNIEKSREFAVEMNEELMLGSLRQHELVEAAEAMNGQMQKEIGERRIAEEALSKAHALIADRATQLEHLVTKRTEEVTSKNKQLEAFVYSIAHDLRAPLRAMQGYAEILAEDGEKMLDATCLGYTTRIRKSAEFMDALLLDLLTFSRISQQNVELVAVNLEIIVANLVSRLQAEIKEKNALVEIADAWPRVMAHEPTLAQTLFNLTSNALKFVRPDVRPLLRLQVESQGSMTRISVEDNGVGIAAEFQQQIFRLFTRLDGERYPGTGLGLAIVKKGVERMGGNVGLDSNVGVGSRFWIDLQTA